MFVLDITCLWKRTSERSVCQLRSSHLGVLDKYSWVQRKKRKMEKCQLNVLIKTIDYYYRAIKRKSIKKGIKKVKIRRTIMS